MTVLVEKEKGTISVGCKYIMVNPTPPISPEGRASTGSALDRLPFVQEPFVELSHNA